MNQHPSSTKTPAVTLNADRSLNYVSDLKAAVRAASNELYESLLPHFEGRQIITITEENGIVTGSLPLNLGLITVNHNTRTVAVTDRAYQNQVAPEGAVSLSTRSRYWRDFIDNYHYAFVKLLEDQVALNPRNTELRSRVAHTHPSEVTKVFVQEAAKLKWHLTHDTRLNDAKKLTVALNKLLPNNIMRATMRYAGVTRATLWHFNKVWRQHDNLQRLTPALGTLFVHYYSNPAWNPESLQELQEGTKRWIGTTTVDGWIGTTTVDGEERFISKRAWRYLNALTPIQVRAVLSSGDPPAFLEALANAGETPRYTTLVHLSRVYSGMYPRTESTQSVFSAYARTISRYTQKMRGITRFHATNLNHIGDYILSVTRDGLTLDKNQLNSPLSWWITREQEYHEQFFAAQQNAPRYRGSNPQLAAYYDEVNDILNNAIFNTSITSDTVKTVRFEALTTRAELIEESSIMQHCVSTYDHRCYAGATRIFRVFDKDAHVGTLELLYDTVKGQWQATQCLGLRNTRLGGQVQKAAVTLARRYTKAQPTAHEALPELPPYPHVTHRAAPLPAVPALPAEGDELPGERHLLF